MAVTIISDLSTTNIVRAFNNNIVRFRSTSEIREIRAIKATISLGGYSVDVSPAPNGIFTFNFKEVAKILVNQNHFADGIYDAQYSEMQGASDLIIADNHVYKKLPVTYQIEFEDGTFESATREYRFLRSVIDLEDYRRNIGNAGSTVISLLSPKDKYSNDTFHATMFDGYPFDVAFYLNDFQNVKIENKTTSSVLTLPGRAGVNRFFLSNGIENVTLDNLLPIALGENEIEFSVGNNVQTLFLTKKEACGGALLKWFNNEGGWCYYLFLKNSKEMSFSSKGDFPNTSQNLNHAGSAFTEMGYEKTEPIQLMADHLDRNERSYVNTILGSPKVYLYLNPPFHLADARTFIDVRIAGSKADTESRYFGYYNLLLDIEKPYINSMTM